MTRKEEILKKAIELVDEKYQDLGIKTTHECSVSACQEMGEWADSHPRKGLVDIEKACNYIGSHLVSAYTGKSVIEDFRKAMED